MEIDLSPDEVLVEVGWAWGVPGDGGDRFGAGAWLVVVRKGSPAELDPETALRRVAVSYATSEQAGEYDWNPNWGDVVNEADEALWAAEGMRLLRLPVSVARVSVDHDETFDRRLEVER